MPPQGMRQKTAAALVFVAYQQNERHKCRAMAIYSHVIGQWPWSASAPQP